MEFKNHNASVTLALILAFMASILIMTTAWAALSLVDTHDGLSLQQEEVAEVSVLADADKPQSRAPEPTTLALFGSGIFGMIISFVRKTYHIAKRILDIVLSITAIIVLSPLFLFVAVLIKCTSRGPVIFKQVRVGRDGELFTIYKFRTMKVDAEKETGPVWAQANDSRLIPCGRFLRKAHMDEIPQFINVLKGDMSVIGPRPERPVFVDQLKTKIPEYEKRLNVKPGITGLAQVWHRYDETIEDVKKKIKYDLLYIRRICLWTDIRILFRTVRVVFTGEGAR